MTQETQQTHEFTAVNLLLIMIGNLYLFSQDLKDFCYLN